MSTQFLLEVSVISKCSNVFEKNKDTNWNKELGCRNKLENDMYIFFGLSHKQRIKRITNGNRVNSVKLFLVVFPVIYVLLHTYAWRSL